MSHCQCLKAFLHDGYHLLKVIYISMLHRIGQAVPIPRPTSDFAVVSMQTFMSQFYRTEFVASRLISHESLPVLEGLLTWVPST